MRHRPGNVTAFVAAADDPRAPDVRALLARHMDFCTANSEPQDVHALGIAGLVTPVVTFFSLRDPDGTLLGIGALRHLSDADVELKSMHTAAEARGCGVGQALVAHLLAEAGRRGYARVSLETGAGPAFAPARRLYQRMGFVPGERFADYPESAASAYFTISLPG